MLLGAGSAGFSLCKVLCVRDRADVPRTFCNPVFVPTTDSDGNDVAGICLPDIAVPLATYSGWNVRAASFAGADLCDAFGQKIDFAQTRAERLAAGDPRLSIEERYPNHGGPRERGGAGGERLAPAALPARRRRRTDHRRGGGEQHRHVAANQRRRHDRTKVIAALSSTTPRNGLLSAGRRPQQLDLVAWIVPRPASVVRLAIRPQT